MQIDVSHMAFAGESWAFSRPSAAGIVPSAPATCTISAHSMMTRTISANTMKKPPTVARPMSRRCLARPE